MRRRFKQTEDETLKDKILDVDASMQGTLSFNDPVNLRINGKFEGKLNTKGILMVGERADIAADILGEYITIAGKVSGNIKAGKELKVISPARIVGDIETPVLSIAEGATINGNLKMSSAAKNLGSSSGDTLSLDEVAKYLEVDKDMISEWAENGKLPGKKEGNSWRIDRAALENWVSNEKIA